MSFPSVGFLFRFLPIFLIVYYILPAQCRNWALVIGSLIFYGVGEPKFVFLLIGSVLVNYGIHFLMMHEPKGPRINRKKSSEKRKRIMLLTACIWNLSGLFLFKYSNFASQMLNLALPLGISFVTFQFLSFHVDCKRGLIKERVSFSDFATYICMFPKLISGPIARFEELAPDIRNKRITPTKIEHGLQYFTIGLALKVLLADQIATLWNSIMTAGPGSLSTPVAWLGAVAYSLQLYFDFFGYSVMAIGIGEILGFSLPINFEHPYCSKSISMFWRRWHITLGKFFRDYVYIPLGGNRKGRIRTVFNLLVVWALTGLWHGAGVNFLIWGLFFFCFITLEKGIYGKWIAKTKIIGHLYILLLIPVSWVIFAIPDKAQLMAYLGDMIGFHSGVSFVGIEQFVKYIREYGLLLAVSAVFITPFPMKLYEKWQNKWFTILILLALFWFSVQEILVSIENPFLYFKF